MIKLGNTWFNPIEVRKMTLKQFTETYKDLLKEYPIKKAYIELGGKIKKK